MFQQEATEPQPPSFDQGTRGQHNSLEPERRTRNGEKSPPGALCKYKTRTTWFHALLTDSAREVRFERMTIGQKETIRSFPRGVGVASWGSRAESCREADVYA